MKPETKVLFERACDCLGVSAEARAAGWKFIADLRMDADDPTTVVLALNQAFAGGVQTMLAALKALPQRLDRSAQAAVQHHAEAMLGEVVSAIQAELEATRKAWLSAAMAQSLRIKRNRMLILGLGILVAVLIGTGLAGAAGYSFGRMESASIAGEFSAYVGQPSADDWLQVMNLTPGFDLSKHCSALSGERIGLRGDTTGCVVRISTEPVSKSHLGYWWTIFAEVLMRGAPAFSAIIAGALSFLAGRRSMRQEHGKG